MLGSGGWQTGPSIAVWRSRVSQGRVTPTIDLSPTPPSPLAAALEQFERAAEYLHLESALREVLRVPRREWTVRFPVELDDGSARVFNGFRVHHNLSRGPAKGVSGTSRPPTSTRCAPSRC
jgi:hypothetical protein